jgi:peptidoglycan hydrolase CwlO-like protein
MKNFFYVPASQKALRNSLLSSIENLDKKMRESQLDDHELSHLVKQMMETVDAIRTKSSLVEDENTHYRRECAKLMQKLAQVTA